MNIKSYITAIQNSLKYRLFENALLLCQEAYSVEITADILYYYSKTYLESGCPGQGASLCRKHEKLVLSEPGSSYFYALCLFESGKYENSEKVFRHMMDNFKNIDSSYYNAAINFFLAKILQRTHRHDKSKNYYNESTRIEPKMLCAYTADAIVDASGHFNISPLSRIFSTSQHNNPPDNEGPRHVFTLPYSIDLIKGADKISSFYSKLPNNIKYSALALKTLAMYYFKCSKFSEASIIFEKLYELYPFCTDGLDLYSTTLWQLKNKRDLSILVQRYVELAPNCASTWIAAGNLLSLERNSEGAIQMFRRAASIDKSCSYALALAGHEMLILESFPNAKKLFREAIDRSPDEWSAWYGIGSVHFKEDDFDAAHHYMKTALEKNPFSSVLHYILGMVLCKCDNKESAIEEFDKAIEIDPQNLIPLFQKGLLLADLNRNEEALECLKAAESIVPNEPTLFFYRGKIAEKLGNTKEATEMYSDSLVYGYHDRKEISDRIEAILEKVISDYIS